MGDKTDDYADFLVAQERERRMARFRQLICEMPGNGLTAKGFDDGTFWIAYHDADADDDGRPVDRGGSLIEGEEVSERANAKLIAEFLTLAIRIAEETSLNALLPASPPSTLTEKE